MQEKTNILSKVNSPEDLKKLNNGELQPLCQDIRDFLIENISKSGGHLSSNLGSVEISVALHKVFESPKDQIVWDVGHQAYTHKILTGRKDKISTIRSKDGLSGFPNPKESEHDAFIAGHASNSLSAAFGLARAKTIAGQNGYVVAVIGDGAAGGGLFFEGLNNIGKYNDRLIVILNDNKISISKNTGGLAKYLSEIRVRPKYFRIKDKIDRFVTKIPFIGRWLKRKIVKSKTLLKYALYRSNWFEEFGFTYMGPVDGHDVHALIDVLNRAKSLNKPVFVHAETIKGKGYKPAEDNPGDYHGVKPFDIEKGKNEGKTSDGFSEKFGQLLVSLGEKNEKICAISPAMKYATGLDKFATKFPRRFMDVGIAEEHAITAAAGLSANGLIPVVAIYSTFLQRAYDQILHDAALCNQHIIIAVDRAGIVGEDGETHQGIFDVGFLSTIPNVKIYSPFSYAELEMCLNKAVYEDDGIVVIRYPKGRELAISQKYENNTCDYSLFTNDSKTLVISYGRVFSECVSAAKDNVDLLRLTRLGFDEALLKIICSYENILFVEEACERGSVSEQLGFILSQRGYSGKYIARNLGMSFVKHQTVEQAFEEYKIDSDSIENILKEM